MQKLITIGHKDQHYNAARVYKYRTCHFRTEQPLLRVSGTRNTCGLLRVDVGTSVSTSTFQALCRLGGRRARASGVWLATESHLCAYTVTCLRSGIVRFPALQLFPHQALHLLPVYLTVPTQSRILARDLKTQWKPGCCVLCYVFYTEMGLEILGEMSMSLIHI